MKSALDAAHEAQRAYELHERRIDVQLSLLTVTPEADRVNSLSERGGSDVAAPDAEANTKLQGGSGTNLNRSHPHQHPHQSAEAHRDFNLETTEHRVERPKLASEISTEG